MRCDAVKSIGLVLLLGTGVLTLAAADRKPPGKTVPSARSVDRIDPERPWQHDDGRIQHRGRLFDSWNAWREANPQHDHRCGTPVPDTSSGGDGIAGAGDCSLTSTNPTDEYDPSNMDLVIPVVVHVIMNDDGTMGDISRETIERQMVILNDDFSGTGVNSDTNTPSAGIRFVIAGIDPFGMPTTGITRSNDSVWFNDQGDYWNELAWDPTRYVNVYTNTAGGVLGYVNAFPATGSAGQIDDRIVIDWRVFGEGGSYGPPQDLGRILTHEVGHYLGLFHTFHNGCGDETCLASGDLICDTPPHAEPNRECTSANSCGVTDPISNFMNYSWQACMSGFTNQQVRRMRCTILNFRSELASESEACGYTCEHDLNGDGFVDGGDLGVMLARIGGSSPGRFQCGDFDLDGEITGGDLGSLLSAWGQCPVLACDAIETCDDGDECTTDYCVDGECIHVQPTYCGVCGDPDAGSCYESNGSVGCSDQDCCEAICNVDPYCCVVSWDASCRNKAQSGDYPGCDG